MNKIKKFWENASNNQKYIVIGMVVALVVGIVFLALGNQTYFFYSSVAIVGLYVLFRNIK